MARPKGSKNKTKGTTSVDALGTIIKHLQSYGITHTDLSKHYKKGSPITGTDLTDLFAKHKPALERMQVTIARGRTAGKLRPLKDEEILIKFAEKIAEELNKMSPASSLLQRLSEQAKDKPLRF